MESLIASFSVEVWDYSSYLRVPAEFFQEKPYLVSVLLHRVCCMFCYDYECYIVLQPTMMHEFCV